MTDGELIDIAALAARIKPTDAAAASEAQQLLDAKTKPRRSLGRLEDLVCHLAAIRGVASPPAARLTKAIVVMGADHGVAAEGVSAYPQEVTGQMLLNFARGGAAINVLARQAGARIVLVDMGVAHPPPERPEIRGRRIGPGTANFTRGPAMTRTQAYTIGSASADCSSMVVPARVGVQPKSWFHHGATRNVPSELMLLTVAFVARGASLASSVTASAFRAR